MLNHCQQLSIPHPDFLDDVEDHPECCCKQKMGLNLQQISQISLTKTLHFMTWCQYIFIDKLIECDSPKMCFAQQITCDK